ncbi:MAG: (Fe-S)-binding protein [Ignavibacteria bacterium]|nr:(Fe-S)-binding protein [Ignavibacteria bacterium]
MEPVRPTFWNIPHWLEILQYALGFLSIIIFTVGFIRHTKKWRIGRPEKILLSLWQRIKSLFNGAIIQKRIISEFIPGIFHLTIFYGMFILLIGTIIATVDWDVTHLFFGFQFLKGDFYLYYELFLDIFGILLIVGIIIALIRRYIFRPEKLKTIIKPTFSWDSFYLLGILFLIASTGFVVEGLRLSVQNPYWKHWAPIGNELSKLFASMPLSTLQDLHVGFWTTHMLLSFLFIASIPFTKAFHIFSASVNMIFKDTSKIGSLSPANESGVEKITEFTWRQLLQLDSCIWCGRCQEACPAYNSGTPLSPKNLVLKLEKVLISFNPKKISNGSPSNGEGKVHGEIISDAELWACTTCRACEEMCPVFIEHPKLIVDMRRFLINQGIMDQTVQDVLQKLQRYGNSFGQSERNRAKWASSLEFKIKDARKEEVEYLWFTGDYAAYDARMESITQKTAMIFQRAGLDFGILYEGEKNSGNDVRRIGEEGLFEFLKEKNQLSFGKAKFRKIVTTDPHTYNTLKNEYWLNGNGANEKIEVLHYTELIEKLIKEKKLTINKKLNIEATYHDPCYLGRYNGIYDPPRNILKAIGVKLKEMPRNRRKSYCCGAGGGRIWMEDKTPVKERPAENRIREAVSLNNISTFVVACPKDIAMFQDAVKTTGYEAKLSVKDIAELVWDSIEQ